MDLWYLAFLNSNRHRSTEQMSRMDFWGALETPGDQSDTYYPSISNLLLATTRVFSPSFVQP